MKKVIVKLEIYDEKEKKKALKTVSNLSGIQSMSVDMTDRKLTVIGDVDPIGVVNKLRKSWHTELISVGPDKEPEKKKEDDKKKEEEKKKEDEKKKDDDKIKDEDKKKDQDEQIQDLIKAYQNYNPYIMRQYAVHSAEEDPNFCVIS